MENIGLHIISLDTDQITFLVTSLMLVKQDADDDNVSRACDQLIAKITHDALHPVKSFN